MDSVKLITCGLVIGSVAVFAIAIAQLISVVNTNSNHATIHHDWNADGWTATTYHCANSCMVSTYENGSQTVHNSDPNRINDFHIDKQEFHYYSLSDEIR